MSAFGKYMLAQERRRTAAMKREAASRELDLAYIHERLAEIESQHEPLHSRCADNAERERHIDTAFYVVVGRERK